MHSILKNCESGWMIIHKKLKLGGGVTQRSYTQHSLYYKIQCGATTQNNNLATRHGLTNLKVPTTLFTLKLKRTSHLI